MVKLMIDIDGPMADFDKAIGKDIGHPRRGSKEEDLPEMFEPGFFRNLPVTEGAKKYIKALYDCPHFEIGICSKPVARANNPKFYSASEKFEWVYEHFPYLIESVTLTHCKSNSSGDILIDDDEKWCKLFPGAVFLFDIQNPNKSWEHIAETLLSPYRS